MSDLVEISHVTKRFGRLRAVDDISLHLCRGDIFGLMGANGAGKTTLIRMICGLTKPDEGTIHITDRPGYMCQTFSLVEELTVPENIRFYGTLYGLSRTEISTREEAIVQSLQLGPYCNKQVRFLPSGWRQALSFSIAVLAEPAILILDEPTTGLDPLSRRRIWRMIREKAAGGTGVIVSTHYLDEAWNCSRLAILNAGKVVACGDPQEIAISTEALLPYFK